MKRKEEELLNIMKVTFVKPHKTSWECDIIPNILVLRTGDEIKFAVSILFWGIVFQFKLNNK